MRNKQVPILTYRLIFIGGRDGGRDDTLSRAVLKLNFQYLMY